MGTEERVSGKCESRLAWHVRVRWIADAAVVFRYACVAPVADGDDGYSNLKRRCRAPRRRRICSSFVMMVMVVVMVVRRLRMPGRLHEL